MMTAAVARSPRDRSRASACDVRTNRQIEGGMSAAQIQPVFVLSLPRSGSTLVQRVLANAPTLATSPEPWLMLPLLAPLAPKRANSGAWDQYVDRSVAEFLGRLPAGDEAYLREIRRLVLALYRDAAGPDASFFLDKTPPYHWVADALFRLFPDARFVFLWRNPLAVLASTVDTFCGGRWQPYRYRGSLFHGLANLTEAQERHADRSVSVRFEDLVTGGETPWRTVASHIGVDWDPRWLETFSGVDLGPGHGDPTGVKSYERLSHEPLEKWKPSVFNPLRRSWCRRYLNWIGQERLAQMGYDLAGLQRELEGTGGFAGVPRDALDLSAAAVREAGASRWADNSLLSSTETLLRQPRVKDRP